MGTSVLQEDPIPLQRNNRLSLRGPGSAHRPFSAGQYLELDLYAALTSAAAMAYKNGVFAI